MLTTDRITIRKTLQMQRTNLLAFLEKKQSSIKAKDLTNPDNADRAMTFQNNDREKLLFDHIERQLDDVEQALKRLDIGTYGICTDCGENIQLARLEIMPTASFCVKCQRIQDNN